MSTQNDSQNLTSNETAAAPETQVAQGVAEAQASPQASPQAAQPRLSTFLKVSIILLAALSIASIALLFLGDFEGKFERIFSTFIAFAVFVGLTAFDTRRGQRDEWYAPVALIANSYILALLLIVIWMTSASWSLGFDIFWKGLLVIAVTRAVVGCSQLLLGMADGRPKPLGVFALITSLFATLTGILFTAPVAIEVFDIRVPELYWKFAVASLVLTALGLSITLLLRWSYGGDEREAARNARAVAAPLPYQAAQPAAAALPYQAQAPVAAPLPTAAPLPSTPPAPPVPPVPTVPEATESAASKAQPLLPWPTYPDGTPLPIGPDGQPDFSAQQR